ncbi:hypothetical protein ACRRTK_016235 [Alexandromys fortis]
MKIHLEKGSEGTWICQPQNQGRAQKGWDSLSCQGLMSDSLSKEGDSQMPVPTWGPPVQSSLGGTAWAQQILRQYFPGTF